MNCWSQSSNSDRSSSQRPTEFNRLKIRSLNCFIPLRFRNSNEVVEDVNLVSVLCSFDIVPDLCSVRKIKTLWGLFVVRQSWSRSDNSIDLVELVRIGESF